MYGSMDKITLIFNDTGCNSWFDLKINGYTKIIVILANTNSTNKGNEKIRIQC